MIEERWGTRKSLSESPQLSLIKKDVVSGGISCIMSHKNKRIWIVSTDGILQVEIWKNIDKYGHLGEGLSLSKLEKINKLQLSPGQTVSIEPLQVYRFYAIYDKASFIEIQLPDVSSYDDVYELTKDGVRDESSSV